MEKEREREREQKKINNSTIANHINRLEIAWMAQVQWRDKQPEKHSNSKTEMCSISATTEKYGKKE